MRLRLPLGKSARARSIIAIVVGAMVWAAITACNQTVINTPTRSFDRPSDVALTCIQYNPNDIAPEHPHGTFNVHPLSDCEPFRANNLAISVNYPLPIGYIPPLGPGNFVPFLLALVPQSARGELALVDTAQGKLVDLDPYTPGFGFLPVGKLPEHIRSSTDGCLALTANSDSCDLSQVNVSTVVSSALVSLFTSANSDMGQSRTLNANGVSELPLTVPSATPGGAPKRLWSRPTWIEMAPPNEEGSKPTTSSMCTDGDYRAWVALPACQLVVQVHVQGNPANFDPKTMASIDRALRVDKTGVTEVTDLSTIDCPVECANAAGGADALDGGTITTPGDMGVGGPPTTQAWPATLAVDAEPNLVGVASSGRLVIGDGYGERVDIVPFDVASGKIGTPTSVTLDPGDNGLVSPGVRVVRVGPRSAAGKFLYVVARDSTVRVIDLDRDVECETNPDPRAKTPIDLQATWTLDPMTGFPVLPPPRSLGCFPLGDPSTPRRSPFATSPGITLPPGQIPSDVAFVHLDAPPPDLTQTVVPPPAAPGLLVGDFAWIVTSDGKGTVVNIYDACPQPNQQSSTATSGQYTSACIPQNVKQSLSDTVKQFGHPQPLLFELVSHQIRNSQPRFFLPVEESDTTGQPRVPDSTNPCAVAVPPTSPGLPDGGVPDAGACGSTTGGLPSLYRELVPANLQPTPDETRVVNFVDPIHVRNETWALAWEGVIPGSDRSTGAPLFQDKAVTGTPYNRAYLSDAGGEWCGRGALAGDKLIFRGCTVDSECDSAAGQLCVHSPSAFSDVSQGMCLHIGGEDTVDAWDQRCGALLRSQRKFRIISAKQGVAPPMSTVGPPTPPGGTTPPSDTKTDLLELAEAYEPEYPEQTKTCVTDKDCSDVSVTVLPDNSSRPTSCLPDVDGKSRCLLSCNPNPDPTKPDEANTRECGADFLCAASAFGDNRCMRAPIGDASFWQTCMPEVQQYEIHTGDSFLVEGTSSGFLSAEQVAADGECVVPPQTDERVRLFQWRVPLSAPPCPANVNANPLTQSIDPSVLASNICALQQPGGATTSVIHFENPIFNIGVVLPLDGAGRPLIPPDGTSVSMAVTGGGNSLASLLGVDVQAQQPRYAAVAPDGQTVYVVDEGKQAVASGLRGQLLRLFSSSQSVDTTFVVR